MSSCPASTPDPCLPDKQINLLEDSAKRSGGLLHGGDAGVVGGYPLIEDPDNPTDPGALQDLFACVGGAR